ncbi:MAG: hypothetical protein VZR54_06315 [Ruminococcus sp.]|jgi:hypothetical protein|nr:hypothetical protein [Ruminococcus sp.]
MTNTKSFKVTIISTLIAAIFAIAYPCFFLNVKADAATYKGSAQSNYSQKAEIPAKTTKLNDFAKAYYFKAASKTTKGYDWTYKADNNNLKIKCKYDFTAHKYTFKIAGTSYGLTHLTLKYKATNTKWNTVKMTVFVDSAKNIMRTA